MHRILIVALAAVVLAGCTVRDRAILAGAGIGAGVGAVIGSASAGPPGGWAGAAIGGVTGGVIGSMIQPEACYFSNRRGELWQVSCHETSYPPGRCFVGSRYGSLQEVSCPYRRRHS